MGYVGKCSNQAGIVVILYYLSFIFGENNYQAFQVLNIIGLLVSYYCLCKISQISFRNDELKNWTLILLFIFFPLTFYIAFVYGNIFGHAFSLLAILAGYQYFETGKIKYILLSIGSIIFAMMFKSNYLIVFVAMVIFICHIITHFICSCIFCFIIYSQYNYKKHNRHRIRERNTDDCLCRNGTTR